MDDLHRVGYTAKHPQRNPMHYERQNRETLGYEGIDRPSSHD